MIDDRNDSTRLIDEPEGNLPPPRFDEKAAANAQPVQPIPTGRFSAFHNRATSLLQAAGTRYRALALIVLGGLATGTLGGMAWVKKPQVTAVSPSANESASKAASPDSLSDSQNREPHAEAFGAIDLQSAIPSTGIRRGRSRARSSRGTRAYRVAVLR